MLTKKSNKIMLYSKLEISINSGVAISSFIPTPTGKAMMRVS